MDVTQRNQNRLIPKAIRSFEWAEVPIEVQQEALKVAGDLLKVPDNRVKAQAVRTIVAFAQLGERAEAQALRLGLEAERLGLERAKFEAEMQYLAELERLKAIVEGRVPQAAGAPLGLTGPSGGTDSGDT